MRLSLSELSGSPQPSAAESDNIHDRGNASQSPSTPSFASGATPQSPELSGLRSSLGTRPGRSRRSVDDPSMEHHGVAQRGGDPSLDHHLLHVGEHPFMGQHEPLLMGQYPAVEQHELQRIAGHGRLPDAPATPAASQQIDSLLDDLGASNVDQKHMNDTITMLKNDLDYNVTVNKYIGKAGDNAKSLVGQ